MALNTTGGSYQGTYRPEWFTRDQLGNGMAGPLYTPPPNPTKPAGGSGTGSPPQPSRPAGGGGGRSGGGNAPSWTPPPRRSGGTSGPSNFGTARVGWDGGPAAQVNWRGSDAPDMPEMPTLDFAKMNFSGPVDRSRATGALDRLGRDVRIGRQRRATLGGPADDNDWETMAREMFGGGFDPGQQYEGYELPDEVFSEAQVNQMAQARAAPTLRAFADAEEDFAREAGRTGTFSPAKRAALRARAALENTGALSSATRDAQLEAAQANAQAKIAKAASRRADKSTDMDARLGLGRMKLDAAGDVLGAGLQRRGLDQTRDLTRYEGDISQRGQDYDVATSEARINTDRAISSAAGERDLASDMAGENIARDRLGLDERNSRNADTLGLGRLGLDRYRAESDNWNAGEGRRFGAASQNADLSNSAAERRARLASLDAQLSDSGMDRNQRAALERERMNLQREMQGLEMSQRQAQFDAELGLRRDQFNEGSRQFNENLGFERESGVRSRDLQRELGGRFGPSSAQVADEDRQRRIKQQQDDDRRRQLEESMRRMFAEQLRRAGFQDQMLGGGGGGGGGGRRGGGAWRDPEVEFYN